MELQYLGANCVYISNKNFDILIDPYLYNQSIPSNILKKAPIILLTQSWPELKLPKDLFVINMPGEYEISGVTIKGVSAQLHIDGDKSLRQGVVYKLIAGDYRLGIVGHIDPKLDEEQQEELGIIDILTIPVGDNGYTLDAQSAVQVVRELDPKLIIPTHYKDNSIKYPVEQTDVAEFVSEMGLDSTREDKLKLKGLLPDTQRVVLLAKQ